MRKVFSENKACFIGTGRIVGYVNPPHDNPSQSVIVAKSLTPEIIAKVASDKCIGIVLGDENPFSHSANVLRVAMRKSTALKACVLGCGSMWTRIAESARCIIDTDTKEIITTDTVFSFQRSKDFISDDIAINSSNQDYICYRPSYFYRRELAELNVQGFECFCEYIKPSHHKSFIDPVGRVWFAGIGFPSDIAQWAIENSTRYIEHMEDYVQVLAKIYASLAVGEDQYDSPNLRDLLVQSYAYTVLAVFPEPSLSGIVFQQSGHQQLEDILYFIAQNVPTSNHTITTTSSITLLSEIIQKMRSGIPLLAELLKTNKNSTTVAQLLLVSSYISQLRRSVMIELRQHNSWFSEISSHRTTMDGKLETIRRTI
jgi:hypothetical protein